MTFREVSRYYDATQDRETRADLKLAVSLVAGPKVAIDCGCGAGNDIAYLRSQGFLVYGFDIEEESISRCRKRFKDDAEVVLSQTAFNAYNYPDASLIVADASLFFCSEQEFAGVWYKITNALAEDGIFYGSFLGPEDTMASPNYREESYWPDILVLSEVKVKDLFKYYKINSFTEYKAPGKTFDGKLHQWHIFSVVASKQSDIPDRF